MRSSRATRVSSSAEAFLVAASSSRSSSARRIRTRSSRAIRSVFLEILEEASLSVSSSPSPSRPSRLRLAVMEASGRCISSMACASMAATLAGLSGSPSMAVAMRTHWEARRFVSGEISSEADLPAGWSEPSSGVAGWALSG